ncbi:MAG: multidrug effflux MFS transporter [Sphingomonas sp.]|nr:multidrug effflux MFS transporter [Sphingomonas sp.]
MNVAEPLSADTRRIDRPPLGFVEFVALVAALMALTALGIDSMLPALPAIGDSLRIDSENQRQFVISAFLLGFGLAQLIHGPLADRYGRKPILTGALALYVIANAVAAIAGSFDVLLAARFLGGMSIAASRVVTIALVRDCYSGRAMARVMSLAFMVFMAAPIFAPLLGQTVLLVGSWRLIFWAIAAIGAVVLAWFWIRMPETLDPVDRIPLSVPRLASGWWRTITDRWSLGYTLASTALMGALYGFINSIQQIVFDVFKRPDLLIPLFACVAMTMAVTNLFNSRIVIRLGMRRISHSALVMLIVVSAVHLAVAVSGHESIAIFAVLQAMTMACFALANSNFSSMAMENMGAIAGTASSVQGFVSVTAGSLVGALIGQSFNGTVAPLFAGYLIAALLALVIVAIAERGRLFRPT